MHKQRNSFILKVTIIHVMTYCICGFAFLLLFHYQTALISVGMRDTQSLIVRLAPLFQLLRGFLFGMVLWIIRNAYLNKKHGWLIIWMLIVVIGIINTPATSPLSIENFIYCENAVTAWNIEIGGTLEIFTQTMLFSIFSFRASKKIDS